VLGHPPISPDSPLSMLGWHDVDRLFQSGLVDFGSHTHSHPILSQCGAERVAVELSRSRDVLLERLSRADHFAYPNGTRKDFKVETKDRLRELGYRCGLTTIPGVNSRGCDRYELRRVNVAADITDRRFELAMCGL